MQEDKTDQRMENEFDAPDYEKGVVVTSEEAIEEEFGPDMSFKERLSELTDEDLHLAVEELFRRAFLKSKDRLEVAGHGGKSLYVEIAGSMSSDGEVGASKYRFRVYNPYGNDATSETFNLILSGDTAARRFVEDQNNQPRKLLAAN